MAKFGLFSGNLKDPMQTFEGDRMVPRDAQYVDIVVGEGQHRKVVATVKLADGQSVKETK